MADTRIIISAQDQTQPAFQSVARGLGGIQSAAAAVGLSLSAIGVVAGLAAVTKQAIDAADRLDELSQITGTSVENLAGLSYAAKQNGASLETVARGAQKLSAILADKPEIFKKLGIITNDSTEAMIQLADVFAALPDGINKSALATKLFGDRLGGEMILFLNQGTEAMRANIAVGREYNKVTAASAAQAAQFNDSLDRMAFIAGGFGVHAANGILPAMNDIIALAVRGQEEYGTLYGILVAIGGAALKIGGVEINPEKRRDARIDQLMSQRGRLNQDIASPASRGGLYNQSGFVADAKAELAQVNAELKALVAEKNATIAQSARLSEAKRISDENARASADKLIKGIGGGAKESLSDYDKLIAKLNGGLVDATVAAQTAQHGYNKAQADFLKLAMSPEWDTMSDRERLRVAGVYERTIAEEMAADATKAGIKAEADAIKSMQDYMSGVGKTTEELLNKAKAAEEENALIGMTADQLALVTARRYDEQNALRMAEVERLKKIQGSEEEVATAQAQVAIIEQQIDAQNRLKNAEVLRPKLQAQADAWQNFARDIEGSLTDALMRGFENGNGFGESFVDTLRNTLKTAALKVAVQAIVSPVMSGIQSAMPGAGGASGGSMDYLSAGQSMWSAFSGSMATSMGSAAMTAGEMLGSTALAEFGAGATYVGAGGTVASAATAGSAAITAGATIASAVPYIAAALVAYELLSADHGVPTTNLGHAGMTFDSSGAVTSSQTMYGGSSTGTDARVRAMQEQYMAAASALGIGTVGTEFRYGANTGGRGNNYTPQFSLSGGAGASSFTQTETAQSDAALQLAASRAVFAALQGSELPGYLSSVFDGLNAANMSQEQITGALAFADSLKQLRDQMTETRAPVDIARAALADLGDSLNTAADTYKTDFVAAIDAGLTPATLARWQQFGALIEQTTQLEAERVAAALGAASSAASSARSVYDAAKSSLLDSYQREIDAAQQLADSMTGFSAGFARLRASLNLGALSTLSPEAKYREAQSQFADISRRSQLGDTEAMAQLEGVSQSFLQASRDYNASSAAYAADFDAVANALARSGDTADRQASIAAQQVTLLRDQLDALGLINTSVLSLADALAAYNAASGALTVADAAVTAIAPTNAVSTTDGGSVAAQINAMYQSVLGREAEAAGLVHWATQAMGGMSLAEVYSNIAHSQEAIARGVPQFAAGGDHLGGLRLVGERGPELEITGPSRIFSADQTRQIMSGGNNAETNALLKQEIVELRAMINQQGAGFKALLDEMAKSRGDAETNARRIRLAVS